MKNWLKLILCIVGCNAIGASGALVTNPNTVWFRTLIKPSFQPPNWLFGPVWTLLFTLMGVALYLILNIKPNTKSRQNALVAFGIQLLINASWSIVYFGLQQIGWAFVVICVLWVAIFITIYLFYKLQKTAALLLVPYLLWVSFAGVLNFVLWQLN